MMWKISKDRRVFNDICEKSENTSEYHDEMGIHGLLLLEKNVIDYEWYKKSHNNDRI
jgi:hypothetical protein